MRKSIKTAKEYAAYQLTYGVYPLLIVMDYFERNEQYEECEQILQGIKMINVYFEGQTNVENPTKLNNESFEFCYNKLNSYTRTNLSKDRFEHMSIEYSGYIFKELFAIKDLSKEIEGIKNLKRP